MVKIDIPEIDKKTGEINLGKFETIEITPVYLSEMENDERKNSRPVY